MIRNLMVLVFGLGLLAWPGDAGAQSWLEDAVLYVPAESLPVEYLRGAAGDAWPAADTWQWEGWFFEVDSSSPAPQPIRISRRSLPPIAEFAFGIPIPGRPSFTMAFVLEAEFEAALQQAHLDSGLLDAQQLTADSLPQAVYERALENVWKEVSTHQQTRARRLVELLRRGPTPGQSGDGDGPDQLDRLCRVGKSSVTLYEATRTWVRGERRVLCFDSPGSVELSDLFYNADRRRQFRFQRRQFVSGSIALGVDSRAQADDHANEREWEPNGFPAVAGASEVGRALAFSTVADASVEVGRTSLPAGLHEFVWQESALANTNEARAREEKAALTLAATSFYVKDVKAELVQAQERLKDAKDKLKAVQKGANADGEADPALLHSRTLAERAARAEVEDLALLATEAKRAEEAAQLEFDTLEKAAAEANDAYKVAAKQSRNSRMAVLEGSYTSCANEATAPTLIVGSKSELAICQPSSRVAFSPFAMPPSRTILNLESTRGAHREVIWDPDHGLRLAREVPLQQGLWKVWLWSRTYVRSSRNDTGDLQSEHRLGWRWLATDFGADPGSIHVCGEPGDGTTNDSGVPQLDARCPGGQEGSSPRLSRFEVTVAPRASTAEAIAALGADPPAESSLRSLGSTVPPEVIELVAILGEIALEQAQSRGLGILSERLELLLCEDLSFRLVQKDTKLAQWLGFEGLEGALLPESCKLVRSNPFENLATAGEGIYAALMSDLADLSLRIGQHRVNLFIAGVEEGANNPPDPLAPPKYYLDEVRGEFEPLLKAVSDLLSQVVTGRRAMTNQAAQALLLKLASMKWSVLVPPEIEPASGMLPEVIERHREAREGAIAASCAAELAFAVMGDCFKAGGCEADEIFAHVSDPDAWFQISEEGGVCAELYIGDPEVGDTLRDAWPEIEGFIARGLELALPSEEAGAEFLAATAIDLFFDVFDLAIEHGMDVRIDTAVAAAKASGDKTSTERHKKLKADRRLAESISSDLRNISHAVLSQDAGRAIAASGSLLGSVVQKVIDERLAEVCDAEPGCGSPWGTKKGATAANNVKLAVGLEKTTALVTAVTSYAATFDGDGTAEEKREARKESVKALIKSSTKRRNRDGDFIVSLGASVGFNLVGRATPLRTEFIRTLSDGTEETLALVGRDEFARLGLPTGIGLQWLPNSARISARQAAMERRGRFVPRAFRGVGAGLHLQATFLDLGRFLPPPTSQDNSEVPRWTVKGSETGVDEEVPQIRWDQFFSFGAQVGVLIGTPSNSFVIGIDARVDPTSFAVGPHPEDAVAGISVGLFASYYVPFFDFN